VPQHLSFDFDLEAEEEVDFVVILFGILSNRRRRTREVLPPLDLWLAALQLWLAGRRDANWSCGRPTRRQRPSEHVSGAEV